MPEGPRRVPSAAPGRWPARRGRRPGCAASAAGGAGRAGRPAAAARSAPRPAVPRSSSWWWGSSVVLQLVSIALVGGVSTRVVVAVGLRWRVGVRGGTERGPPGGALGEGFVLPGTDRGRGGRVEVRG